ncbi:uncharacterized protein [Bactrocera oleae]|uniref:uncharacterized protein n=1 Tax=Bactrocera oleae TaxID=104688 RepID=UPI0006B85CC6|nr:uncharacterized protein LOC106618110 [Bactrocera oleae]
MDLTSNSKRNSQQCWLPQRRSASVDDDDNVSNNSVSSFNVLLTAASDSESHSPVSVRDMIKRYDTVAKLGTKGGGRSLKQQQYSLPAMKSAYFGVNNFGTHTLSHRYPSRHYVTQKKEEDKDIKSTQINRGSDHSNSAKMKNNCKPNNNTFTTKQKTDAMDDSCFVRERHVSLSDGENIYVADHTRRTSRSPARDVADATGSLEENVPDGKDWPAVTESIENANFQPMETSYQSKTTIAKTAGGVRIIIDIFFDQEQQPVSATDVVGSRVETDIPQSRILNEFQQQAAELTRN